eukprot:m.126048 g.126048  ORF g.126048 m.126048 type:complete len:116 (-) comp29175_c0_seq1:106-453(-)
MYIAIDRYLCSYNVYVHLYIYTGYIEVILASKHLAQIMNILILPPIRAVPFDLHSVGGVGVECRVTVGGAVLVVVEGSVGVGVVVGINDVGVGCIVVGIVVVEIVSFLLLLSLVV